MRSDNRGPSLLCGKKHFAFNKMLCITVIKPKIYIFFSLWNVISYPQEAILEVSCHLPVLQSADDPVITASKIQLYGNTAGLSDKSRCKTSHAWLALTALPILFLL